MNTKPLPAAATGRREKSRRGRRRRRRRRLHPREGERAGSPAPASRCRRSRIPPVSSARTARSAPATSPTPRPSTPLRSGRRRRSRTIRSSATRSVRAVLGRARRAYPTNLDALVAWCPPQARAATPGTRWCAARRAAGGHARRRLHGDPRRHRAPPRSRADEEGDEFSALEPGARSRPRKEPPTEEEKYFLRGPASITRRRETAAPPLVRLPPEHAALAFGDVQETLCSRAAAAARTPAEAA